MGFAAVRAPHLIILLFSKHGTFLNDLLQTMPIYPTSHILQHLRESSILCVIPKATDFFNCREFKIEPS